MERSNNIMRLPAPDPPARRPAWQVVLMSGLCVLPVCASVAQQWRGRDVHPGPTRQIVEALNRSALAPAQARTFTPALADVPLARPVDDKPAMLASILQMARKPLFLGPAGDRERAVDCLALAAWYEAGNDVESQRSVMQVVLNRVAHPSFPKSVCGVVFQGSQRSTGCQFTFTCDGSMLRRDPPAAAMARARALATLALQGAVFPAVMQATHYHADYVVPWWSSQLVVRGKIGRHIFYSWPGKRGILPGRPSSVGEAGYARPPQPPAAAPLAIASAAVPATADPEPAEPRLAALRTTTPAPMPPALAPKPGSSIFLALDSAVPSGRWAVSALGRCAGKSGCRVIGYATPDQVARNSSVAASEREKPVFLFVRDPASGIELALWDCDKVQRPAASQCLPGPGRELARMLRESQI